MSAGKYHWQLYGFYFWTNKDDQRHKDKKIPGSNERRENRGQYRGICTKVKKNGGKLITSVPFDRAHLDTSWEGSPSCADRRYFWPEHTHDIDLGIWSRNM